MNDLNSLRKKIDIIDKELLLLFEKRVEVMKEVGEVKKELGRPIRDLQREEEKIRSLLSQTSLPEEVVKRIWTVFFESSEEIEK